MEINGKKVVDAKRGLRFEITTPDAEAGKNKNPSGCAAAVAIVRAYKKEGVKQARVHLGRVYVEYPDKWVHYMTPRGLKTEIVSFDRGTSPQFMAGEYNLLPPSPAEKLGERYRPPGNDSRLKSKRPKIAHIIHQIEGVRARGANR